MAADLSRFPITELWQPMDSDKIQLYSMPTPNGIKVSVVLEELGLPYDAHRVSLGDDEQHTPAFRSLNPNNKIPAIIDPDGPGGLPIGLFESGAILIYLAEKTGRLMPDDPVDRLHCLQWLMFQMGGVGPMFGQFGHFHRFAADKVSDPYPRQRYLEETRRLLSVLDGRLAGREYVMGEDYTIADIALFPWVRALDVSYGAREETGLDAMRGVSAWLERCLARPAVKRAIPIPEA
jgi:GST-like protein